MIKINRIETTKRHVFRNINCKPLQNETGLNIKLAMKINRITAIVFACIATFLLLAPNSAKAQIFSEDVNEQTEKFGKVLNWVNRYYVDTVNEETLVEEAIVELLKQLDPHSNYISKKDVQATNEPLYGSFDGIGVTFNLLNDTIFIISPTNGGPSERMGIRAGDRIVSIEGENVAGIGITNDQVRVRLLGKKGTKVQLGVKRRGNNKVLDFTVTRDKIPIYSVDASYMIAPEIGYIKINRFSATTMDEFNEALTRLRALGLKHLILDLQDNGGGYLNTATSLADEFLKKDQLIVYTEGNNSPKTEYRATDGGSFEEGRLALLIDEGAASASEIVSGAIQDWDRGVLVGRRSYGKGLVQRGFFLPDGSMVRLTVARYFTPTGRLIQKPYDEGTQEYRNDIANRYKHGEMYSKDSISFADSLKFYTLSNKRLVYGGGGIMPDVFVPLDTSLITNYYNNLVRKGIINDFSLTYIDNHREELKVFYPDFETYNNLFVINNNIYSELKQYIVKHDSTPQNTVSESTTTEDIDKQFNDSKSIIAVQLKALIARDLWGLNEYYQVINSINPCFKNAVSIITDKSTYRDYLK